MGPRPRRLRRTTRADELRALVDETIALFHRLRWIAEQIYAPAGRSMARRGILRGLVRYGPQTVPRMARTRFVTRQHVQELVDALNEAGLVQLIANPAHKRSRLVRATPAGERLVKQMDTVDAAVLAAVGNAVTTRDLDVTVRTMRALRDAFERGRWRSAAARA